MDEFKPPLITRAQVRPPASAEAAQFTLTFLAWAAYVYLWLPAITGVMWALGIRRAYLEWQGIGSSELDVLRTVAIIAIVVSTILVLWAEYNRWRFQGKNHRKMAAHVTNAEVAQGLGCEADLALKIREARCMTLIMSETAVPEGIRTSGPGSHT